MKKIRFKLDLPYKLSSLDSLDAISPLDGRYREKVEELASVFSEHGLIDRRVGVIIEYLLALAKIPEVGIREITSAEKEFLRGLFPLVLKNAGRVKYIETVDYNGGGKVRHDVKSVEIYLREIIKQTSLADIMEWMYFACTSEDINNIAFGFQLRSAIQRVVYPNLLKIRNIIHDSFVVPYAELSMLLRSHGKAASPGKVGKEFKVFSRRLDRELKKLREFKLLVKFNGATGNFNAHNFAFPEVDWIGFSQQFIDSFNTGGLVQFEANMVTTQIENHDTYAELFDIMSRINVILIDFCQDLWRYISDDWFVVKAVAGEAGSSVMPNKVNPEDLETAEGNLLMANAMFELFSRVLPVSRLQRHLSDSTLIRNFGVAFGHSLLAYKYIQNGLGRIMPDQEKIFSDLEAKPEVLSEAIQTLLRARGIDSPYDKLKNLTRGKKVTLEELHEFIKSLGLPQDVEDRLLDLRPSTYTGLASTIALRDDL